MLAPTAGRAQAPETRGSLTFMVWDAGMIPAAGTNIRTRVYYPDTGGPYPLVGVIHGANANGGYHTELASTLASRGFVCVVPDMPCGVTSCDHDANQRQISALLEWAVAQSADGASRVAGRIDGSRRGLIGHSWGGLSSHLTAARDPSIDSVVLLDPNDDGGVGLAATSTITAPVLQLLAEVPGACNSAWQEAMVRARLTPPNLQMTLNGSGHCSPGEMDLFCSFACTAGDNSTTPLFRRYAVAWTACVLAGDTSMAGWVGGSDFGAQVSSGVVEGVFETGLGTLPCRAGGLPDAGPSDVDAGAVMPIDAGSEPVDGGGGPIDSGTPPGTDAGDPPTLDAGTSGPPASDGGCACGAAGRSAREHGSTLVAIGLGLAVVLGAGTRGAVRRRR